MLCIEHSRDRQFQDLLFWIPSAAFLNVMKHPYHHFPPFFSHCPVIDGCFEREFALFIKGEIRRPRLTSWNQKIVQREALNSNYHPKKLSRLWNKMNLNGHCKRILEQWIVRKCSLHGEKFTLLVCPCYWTWTEHRLLFWGLAQVHSWISLCIWGVCG